MPGQANFTKQNIKSFKPSYNTHKVFTVTAQDWNWIYDQSLFGV